MVTRNDVFKNILGCFKASIPFAGSLSMLTLYYIYNKLYGRFK